MAENIVERWLPVVGYEGLYSVSDFGQIRSELRTIVCKDKRPKTVKRRILQGGFDSQGRRHFTLSRNGSRETALLHRVVLLAFRGYPMAGEEGCHNDGNHLNNALGNLRWDTKKSNQRDRIEHGTDVRGTKYPRCKLTADQVRTIRADSRSSYIIGPEFGVSATAIRRIHSRKLWGWLE